MLAYAAADTRHLLALRDLLASKLEQVARLDWASEEFRRLEDVRWTGTPPDDGDAYLRIRGAGTLRDPRARAILKALYEWRDAAARKADRAPFRVIGNDALLAVARAAPRDQRALEAVPGLPRSLARRHGSGLLDAVANGMAVPNDRLPVVRRTLRHPADPAYDQRLERLKSLRNARAGESGMDPGLLCPNATLQALARAIPSSPADIDGVMELRSWQRRLLGDRAILTAVAG
jgi:ribonuclease D